MQVCEDQTKSNKTPYASI